MAGDQCQKVQKVADRLKVGEATVRDWIKQGDLRVIKLGKRWRIAGLQAFVCNHATRASRTAAQGGGLGRDARIRRESGA